MQTWIIWTAQVLFIFSFGYTIYAGRMNMPVFLEFLFNDEIVTRKML